MSELDEILKMPLRGCEIQEWSDAIQAYISKKVAAELVRENQKMINTIKKIKGDTDGVSWDGLTRALRHRILELELAQLTEGSKD